MIERRYAGARPVTELPAGAIDTQLHLYMPGFPARPGGPGLPPNAPGLAEYRQVMARLGIERFVITQGNAHQFDNANILAALAEAGDHARGVGVITEQTSDLELEALSAAGVVGARIMDLPGGAVGLDRLEAVDARAAAAGWMLAVQFDGGRLSEHMDRLMGLRARWVLDHHGKFFRGISPEGPEVALLKRLVDNGRCWFKFAGCYESSRSGGPEFADVAGIARIMAAHAPERIVWGTNFPHNAATSTEEYPDDAALCDTVLGWLPDGKGRRLALVENPEALYGFAPFRRTQAG